MQSAWRKQYVRYKAYLLNTVTQYEQRKDVRVYLEILLSLATVSLFAIFAVRPTLITIAELLNDIEKKKETIATLDKKLEDLQAANQVYQAQRANITLLNEAIPSDPSPEMLIRQMEGLSGDTAITIQAVNVQSSFILGEGTAAQASARGVESFPGTSQPLSFSFSVAGSYQSLFSFLDRLETVRRPVVIDSLNFTNNSTAETGSLQLVIQNRTPYLK